MLRKNTQTPFLTRSFLLKNFLFGGLFLLFSAGISASFSYEFDKEIQPNGKLKHGSYTHWIENALETPPESNSKELKSKRVAKQAATLATKKGEKVMWIVGNKIGIGIQIPEEILDIRSSEKASLAITSSNNNASLFLNNGLLSLQNKDFFLQLGSQKIFFTKEGINVLGQITIQNKNVVLAEQKCPEGKSISGTDNDGAIICETHDSEVQYCNLNTLSLSEDIRVISRCKLAP